MAENPHAATCPSCDAEICLRCIALERRMNPDGLDGCAECERLVKRTQKALVAHWEKHHDPEPEPRAALAYEYP